MKQRPHILLSFLLSLLCCALKAQNVVVSAYMNEGDARDEWAELVVIKDSLNMAGYTLRDNSSGGNWQAGVTCKSMAFWRNMRAGTIIILRFRPCNSSGTSYTNDVDKTDGYIELDVTNTTYFTLGASSSSMFSNNPCTTNGGSSFTIAGGGDILQILDSSGSHVHALGHGNSTGSGTPRAAWNSLNTPKIFHTNTLNSGEVVAVCPGDSLALYNGSAGTTLTNKTGSNYTFGLPNTCGTNTTNNASYWRKLRQPVWNNPALTTQVDSATGRVTLTVTSRATDPIPGDSVTGYLVLRNTTNSFDAPSDGTTYSNGNNTGSAGATVVGHVRLKNGAVNITDYQGVSCGNTVYYQVYAFKYGTDQVNGNTYNTARGRAYNESIYATGSASRSKPLTSLIYHY